jgi:hypothetical protein
VCSGTVILRRVVCRTACGADTGTSWRSRPDAAEACGTHEACKSAAAARAAGSQAGGATAAAEAVAHDLRMKRVYTTGDQKTESVTYRKGERERFEFGDVVLLRQHHLKRTVQIMRAANSYMIVPDGTSPAAPPAATAAEPNAPPQKPGVVMMTTSISDTGERRTAFGLQARHVKTAVDKQPTPGACDPAKQHIETDGWYVDLTIPAQSVPDVAPPQMPAACFDEPRRCAAKA